MKGMLHTPGFGDNNMK